MTIKLIIKIYKQNNIEFNIINILNNILHKHADVLLYYKYKIF